MLQGFRWQFLAFIASVILFVIVLIVRNTGDDSDPNPTLQTTQVAVQPTTAPTNTPIATQPETQNTSDIPSNQTSEDDGIVTYREGLVGDVRHLNPLLAELRSAERDISSLIYEGLTTVNPYGEVVPELAADWVVSFDGLEYVVTLRDDVLWQDGIPFTAADVMYTVSLLRDPDFTGPEALSNFWRTIETEQINDHLVRFRLTQPLASFPDALRIGILPAHALEGTTAADLPSHLFNLTPVGTGPYQIEAIRQDDSGQIRQVDLRVSPNYRLRPEGQNGYALERLRFTLYSDFDSALTALQTGEIDAYAARNWDERLALLGLGGQVIANTTYEPAAGFVIFNWANDDFQVFREERVRRALYMSLDVDSIIKRHLSNRAVAADSPILPLSWAYDSAIENSTYDPAAAANELAIANIRVEAPADGQPLPETAFSFSLLVPDTPELVSVAQEIVNQWSQISFVRQEVTQRIDVRVEAVAPDVYAERIRNGEFQAAIVELSKAPSADPDVYAFWHQGQYPDGQNYGGVNDGAISEALERARRDDNGINRILHYDRFQDLFLERAIAIPLYYPLFTYAVVPDVEGVQVGYLSADADRFNTIKDWQIIR